MLPCMHAADRLVYYSTVTIGNSQIISKSRQSTFPTQTKTLIIPCQCPSALYLSFHSFASSCNFFACLVFCCEFPFFQHGAEAGSIFWDSIPTSCHERVPWTITDAILQLIGIVGSENFSQGLWAHGWTTHSIWVGDQQFNETLSFHSRVGRGTWSKSIR